MYLPSFSFLFSLCAQPEIIIIIIIIILLFAYYMIDLFISITT